jgi:putative acetyltransferase
MTKAAFQPVFDDLQAKNLIYVFEHEGQSAGMFKLIPLTYRTDHIAYLGGVAIDPAFMGKGLGQVMMNEILDLGRARGLLRIELSTATINERAIRLYEKMGFEKEGILRKYTYLKSEDRFLDEVLMAVFL